MIHQTELDGEMEDLLARCYTDLALFGRTFFPERFYRPFSKLHHQIFELIQSKHQKVCIAAPRGFGKTSTINMLLPAHQIVFSDAKYIVPVSCTANAAVEQSENLKMEMMSNEDLIKFFGILKSDSWSKEKWQTSTGIQIYPRGSGQQIRGMLYRNYRPDLFVVDDLEDPEDVRNEETRKKQWEWFHADLLGAVDKGSQNWRVIVIGTVLHEDSLLNNLFEDSSWEHLRLSLCDDNYKSFWPSYMTDEQVKGLAEDFRRNGDLDIFYREYRNMPISTEDAIFSSKHFRYYEETDESFQDQLQKGDIENIVLVDPAKTVKMSSDDSAIVGVGVNTKLNSIYYRDCVSGKFMPDEIYEHAINMCDKLGSFVLGIEVNSLNEFILYPLRNELARRGKSYIHIVELKPRDKKENRISMMAPFYRQGQIYHNRSCSGPLEAQLMSFPRSKKSDIMDAFAYFIPVLEEGSRYFPSMYSDDDDYEKIEAEYKKLENSYEPALEGMRII